MLHVIEELRLPKQIFKIKYSKRSEMELSTLKSTPKSASIVLLCLLLTLINPALAIGQPASLRQKQEEASKVKKQLQSIDSELEVTVEEYNQAQLKLDQIHENIKKTKEDYKLTSKKFGRQKKLFNSRVVGIYKTGNISFASSLLGTKSFVHFLTHVGYLIQIGNQDYQLLQEIQQTKKELEETKKKLEIEEQSQIAHTKELQGRRSAIESQISERRSYLAAVETDLQAMIRAEEEREARTQAAEVRQRQQQQPAQNNNPQNQAPNNPNNNPNNGNDGAKAPTNPPKSNPAPPSSAPHSQVVSIAMQHLGKPYQWGAAGPDSFDCSGLVMYCYAQIGISLPHSAASQYNRGAKIARENLASGDLVFFGKSSVSHVGIYAGGGQYIHAPHTGDVVKVSSLNSRSDYYGACRP